MKIRALLPALLTLFASCSPSSSGGGSPDPAPQPAGEAKLNGVAIVQDGSAVIATLSDGTTFQLLGETDPDDGSWTMTGVAVEDSQGAISTVEIDASGWGREVTLPDGDGLRLEPMFDGTSRARMWDESGVIILDEIVAGGPTASRLPAPEAPEAEDTQPITAPGEFLTVHVPVLDCDGNPSREIVQRAQSCMVIGTGPRGLFQIKRIAQRQDDEFVAEFPADLQLSDLSLEGCDAVLSALEEQEALCWNYQTALDLLCVAGAESPIVEGVCAAVQTLFASLCQVESAILGACALPPSERPPLPEGYLPQLKIDTVTAWVRLRTCEGFVNRVSNPHRVYGDEVEIPFMGCTGNEGGVSPKGIVFMGNSGIIGGDGTYELFWPIAGTPAGLHEEVVEARQASLPVSPFEIDECQVTSSGTLLSTIWTRGQGKVYASAERTGGHIQVTGTITQEEEKHHTATPDELEDYEKGLQRCLQPIEAKLGGGAIIVSTSLMPFQKARLTATLHGEAEAEVHVLGGGLVPHPLGPGQSFEKEISYEELAELYTAPLPFEPSELPPGIFLPDLTFSGPCLEGFFVLTLDVTRTIGGLGSAAVDANLTYHIDILDD